PASVPSDAGVPTESTSPATAAPAATATTRATRPRPTPSTAGRPGVPTPAGPPAASPISPAPPAPGTGAPASTDPGPAPPFYNSGSSGDAAATPAPAASSPSGGAGSPQGAAPSTQKSTAPAPAGPPLRVGIVTGDAAQEAGFRAYVDRLNQSGGVRGHEIDLVPVSPASPAADTIATVNLSAQPVAGPGGAPSWAGRGPLLETLTATENLLAGNGAVFSFASPPERQGHLAADALFPSTVKNRTAVIYAAPSGPLSDAVPAAMRAVLESRGVRVVVVTYDPDAPQKAPLREGVDAALLSLDPAAARAWVAEAKAAGYRPALGVAGIYSLADATLAPDLPEGARVISPYVVPAGAEGEAIRSAAGGTSAPVLHGWVGAKALAAAIWRTGADTPAELQSALEALTGWSPGLAPAYETRPGTRSRTPEGVLLQVQSGAFATDGAWRRDPF
ncbi:MAG TPA: ABC transporter substrate-binding protein, partial [Acidimicrobiia bacterium]|nr:ABC transporter substrate-binding protein [Acidimicrobiia bacterium]